jgi:type IV pilus assembly protein PilY1
MTFQYLSRLAKRIAKRTGVAATLAIVCLATAPVVVADIPLADQPVFAGADVPGNLALALSVEFPTAISVANLGAYADASTYLGYFDPQKCYVYTYNSTTPAASYFQPASHSTGTYGHQCAGQWSGNFMNWATMQTIDPFRWALSGGYRSVDNTSQTILEKAWGSSQGALSNFPYRGTGQSGGSNLPTAQVPNVTPFTSWTSFNLSIWSRGNVMAFSGTGNAYQNSTGSLSDFTDPASAVASTGYRVYVRVRVCDATTTMGVGGLESNCVKYGSNYKPEGLLQQYSSKIRFSAFSYLNQNGHDRQGGVLREPMGFIGPTYPQPFSATPITNSRPEWDATTGIMSTNPDTSTASASGVSQSGVMNYLNKFGETAQTYMTYDNVSELYYAAIRYFENLGNVNEWTNSTTSSELDGFPAVTTWADPIAYSCQKNFILGIGDDHTWYDYNVGGDTNASGDRAMPNGVQSDSVNMASSWTTKMQVLEGITQTPWWPHGDSGSTYFIAGLAYGAHVNDIRPDLANTQTVSTFWMDVEEDQEAENLNPYYLAAKYGGFSVPTDYSLTNTTPLDPSLWNTSGTSINMNGSTHPQPDNYFLAGNASQMVSGLKSAFANIANAIKAYTTSFSLSTANVASTGTASFSSQYDSTGWTGVVTGSTLTFDSNGSPSSAATWSTTTTLQAQLAGTGWQTGRNVATWNGTSGVPFEVGSLTSTQLTALLPSYSSSTTSTQYLNYLRGDRTNEVGSTVTGSTKSLRARTLLLGDIVDANLTPVTTPEMTYSESTNPGYAAFKTQWTTTTPRPTMVYAAANDGMLHGFLGDNGHEQFAYIPSATFQGPNNTPQVDGLAQLGNPNYSHHYYVDATPLAFDVDLNHTAGASGAPNWHTLLIGGLGKGGKSYYAIDVTDPASMTTETAVAGKVKWEFTDSTMGYSFGAPIVVKTAKYGWVVVLTSGYNNSDGYGYVYLVNPSNGALLEKIVTPISSNGLAHASAYVMDYTDYTADSIYVGDLNGQLWRFDLTGTPGNYPSPTLLAQLTDGSGIAQPVTTEPLIAIYPSTRKRFVMVGTGRLLSTSDVISSQVQSFYAIIDGTAGGFGAVSTPITRSELTQVTNVLTGVTLPAASKGWYTDLGATSGIGWRVVIDPVAYNGVVSFATLLTSGDACSPSGQGRVYAIDYSSGTSVLGTNNISGAPVQDASSGYIALTSSVINLMFVNVNGSTELVAGTAAGSLLDVYAKLSGAIATRLLNWREIPTAD